MCRLSSVWIYVRTLIFWKFLSCFLGSSEPKTSRPRVKWLCPKWVDCQLSLLFRRKSDMEYQYLQHFYVPIFWFSHILTIKCTRIQKSLPQKMSSPWGVRIPLIFLDTNTRKRKIFTEKWVASKVSSLSTSSPRFPPVSSPSLAYLK